MLQALLEFRKHKSHIKQVSSLLFHLPRRLQLQQFHSLSSSSAKPTCTSQYSSSAILSAVEKSVKSGSLSFSGNKGGILHDPILKDCLLRLSEISPATVRRFWRVSVLNPNDVLEIFLGSQIDSRNFEVEVKKIESLWGIYMWASKQSKNFRHLPKASGIMATMLVHAGLFKEIECLVSLLDIQGTFLDNHEIYSNLIEVFVADYRLEKAIACYDRMRMRGVSPSISCYRVVLEFLIQIHETQLSFQIYADAIDIGLGRNVSEGGIYEGVIRLLCADAKVQDARNLIKKILAFGIEPSYLILDSIASGYCIKRDYDDLLSFFVEISSMPDVTIVNKLIQSVCGQFGVASGNSYILKLDQRGFCMNEITFGILIGWACREGKLKDAFFYLSEILSRNLKPNIYSYDAILSGLFKEGMWKHCPDILQEMEDQGVEPQLSTFRVLLAGFCKARRFDEVNPVVSKMVDRGLIQLSRTEDPLSVAFGFLGLDSSAVKIRRDNDIRFHKAEFFDNLGNGLYLDTDVDEYERAIDEVLNDAMLPDFNTSIGKDYKKKDMKNAVMMVDRISCWGQEISLGALDALVKGLCASSTCIKTISGLLEKVPNLTYQLDQETLNKLVQKFSKKGYVHKARAILHGMLGRHLRLDSETYTALMMGLCKKGDLRGLTSYWKFARTNNWLPDLKDGKTLFGLLCRRRRLNEALELFKALLVLYPDEVCDAFHVFLEELSAKGFTIPAKVLAKEILCRGCISSHSAHSHLILAFCNWRTFGEAAVICDSMLAKDWIPPLGASLQLIPQLCRSGRVREATSLFQETLAKELYLSVEICDVLFQGYCQANKRKKVEELLGVVISKNLGISISSYRNIVRLMCTGGKVSTALWLKDHILKQSNPPTAVIYNILIYSLFTTNKTSVVNTLVHDILGKGLQLDEVTYNYLVQGFCWCEDLSSAIRYLKSMMEKDLRPSNRSLREVIKWLCCYGELDEALILSKEMEFRGWNHGSVIQNHVVETLLLHGKLGEAVNFLDRMAIKCLIPENIDYNYLIKRLCQHGMADKSVDLMDIMLRKGNVPESNSFDYVIQSFCAMRKLDIALNFHAEMLCRNQRPSINTCSILIKSLSEGGQLAEAEKQLDLMVQLGEIPRRETYSLLINMYRSQNNLNKASELLRSMQRCGYEPDFETHWSLIRNLRDSSDNINDGKQNGGFLSRFLSEIGFVRKNKGG